MANYNYHIRVFTSDFKRCTYDTLSNNLNEVCTNFENWYSAKKRNDNQRVICWSFGEVRFDGTLRDLVKRCLDTSIVL